MLVLFDLDGTLLDTAPDFAHVINRERAKKNLQAVSLDKIRPAVSDGLEALMKTGFDTLKGHAEYDELCKITLSGYEDILAEYTKPFPGIPELLHTLETRNIPWGIVTNKSSNLTLPLLANLGFAKNAACVVSGDTTPHYKPHPEPLLHACRELHIPPSNAIYIGDAERDIIAGKTAGMKTILALFGYIADVEKAMQFGADHVVHHADEILPRLEAWHP